MDYSKIVAFSPIIVAIITVVGTLAPSFLSNIAIQTSNRPNIVLEKGDVSYNKKISTIDIRNTGSARATNLTVVIDSPINIHSVMNKFSFVDLTLPGFGNSVLKQNAPVIVNRTTVEVHGDKLAQGGGDLIVLEVTFDHEQDSNQYHAFAIYDQGSATANVSTTFFSFSNPSFWIVYGLLYVGVGIFYYYYYSNFRKKRYARSLIRDLVNVRRVLTDKPDNDQYISGDNVWILERMRRYIKDIKDLIKLDDLFTKLKVRRKAIEDRANISQLMDLNRDCLRLTNDALFNIDWKKYT